MIKNNTLNALISLGFTQEEAQNQLKELNNVILGLVLKRIMEESPGVEINEQNLKEIIETKYSKEEYQNLLEAVGSDAVKGYFEAITKDMVPLSKQAFYETVKLDFAVN